MERTGPQTVEHRKRFGWQWAFHRYQSRDDGRRAVGAAVVAVLSWAVPVAAGHSDSWQLRAAASLFTVAAWCSYQASLYQGFIASHKMAASNDETLPIRWDDLVRSHRWHAGLVVARETAAFIGALAFVLGMVAGMVAGDPYGGG